MALNDPKSPEWLFAYAAAGTIDVAQWIADFLIGPGELGNGIADPLIGVGMAAYFQLRGISMMSRPSRVLSLIGGVLAEELSVSVAPAWIVDVWYMHKTVKDEQATRIEASTGQEETLNQGGVRAPRPMQPRNQNGRREPSNPTRSTGGFASIEKSDETLAA